MRKWAILGIVAAVLCTTVVIAFLQINSYLERHHEWIVQQARAALGRDLRFERVRLSLRGGLGAALDDVHIAEDPRIGSGDFVSVRQIRVAVRLLPALRGRYEVRHVILDDPIINVIRTRNGYNFDSLAAGKTPPVPQRQDDAPMARQKSPAAALPFLVSRILVRNARLRYRDETTDPTTDVRIDGLDIQASGVSLTTPISIDLSASLFGRSQPNFKLRGSIGPIGANVNPQAIPLDLRLELNPFVLDDLKTIAPAFAPSPLSAPDAVAVKISASGTPKNLRLTLDADASAARVAYGQVFTKTAGIPLRIKAEAQRTPDSVKFGPLLLTLASLQLTGRGNLTTGPTPTIEAQLDSQPASLSGWGKLFPALQEFTASGTLEVHVQVSGPLSGGALPRVTGHALLQEAALKPPKSSVGVNNLSTRIEFTGDGITVPPTKFSAGGETVEISAKLKDLKSPTGSFTLRSPALHLAAFSPGRKGESEDVLRDLDITGTLTGSPAHFAAKLKSSAGNVRGITYANLSGRVQQQAARRFAVENVRMDVFGGSVNASGQYDASRETDPRFSGDVALRGVLIQDFLARGYPAAAAHLQGRLDGEFKLSGHGDRWNLIEKNLAGTGKAALSNGTLKNINIAEAVIESLTGVSGLSGLLSANVRKKHAKIFRTRDTVFDDLRGALRIVDGRLLVNKLRLAAQDYAVTADGGIGFDGRMKFQATFLAARDLTRDLIKSVREARYLTAADGRLSIPFRLDGVLPQVRPKPDTAFLLQALRAGLVDEGLGRLFGRKNRKTGPETAPSTEKETPERELLRKGLEGLFGR